MLIGLGNYIVPLQIGARDMAFPRINALSLWLLIFAGLVMEGGFLIGGTASSASWTAYVPLSSKQFSPQVGMDIWLFGIVLLGISSTVGAVNFLVTIYTMRAPWHDALAYPDLHLDNYRHRRHDPAGDARSDGGADHADHRPQLQHAILYHGQPALVAKHVLVLFSHRRCIS